MWQYSRRARVLRYLILVIFLIFTLHQLKSWSSSREELIVIQHGFGEGKDSLAQEDRLRAVQHEFLHAWRGYKDHAWMSDSLTSLTGGRNDQFCGWSATLIDTLDTLWLMDLKEEFDEAIEAALSIDFAGSAASCEVNAFESTIRYLGGMLAVYDLSQDPRLLPKLIELGDLLHSAFNSSTGMPCTHCNLGPNHPPIFSPGDAPLADIGSFYLELGRLWQITKDPKYLQTLLFLTETFERTQNQSTIPGLWPQRLDTSGLADSDADFATSSHEYSLGALSDSAYEYLVKSHLMLGSVTPQYARMWDFAATQIRHLMLFRAYIPPSATPISDDLLFTGILTRRPEDADVYLQPRTEHLACFAGGLFALASRIFHNPGDLSIAAALTNGCVWAYNITMTGIMPETVTLLECPNAGPLDKQCEWNQTAWDFARSNSTYCTYPNNCNVFPTGFLASLDMHYGLRPEAIESIFIMYRITGDESWRDKGWVMFQHIIEHTRTPFGHASLDNTMIMIPQFKYVAGKQVSINAPIQRDEMESFWLAETLKYFWLLFSDPELLSLDEWVLNTEAHPLRLVEGQRAYF